MQKRGVALVTVLFFMLVAIIAATALFKWLKYMGESSAAELKRTEAYQASQAGVETVRAWLQYDANDVGAIIGYYMNEKVPVRMDSVLAPLQSNKDQKFSVYLIAADVQSYPYKLKFVSTGTGRNGSRYSQAVIFDVNGLFQVYQPSESSLIDFNKAFFGSYGSVTGSDSLESGVINGDYKGNVPKVSQSLLVTGNVVLQGSTTIAGADTYIGGNFSIQGASTFGKSGSDTTVLYVGGDVTDCAGATLTVYGDAYFAGDIAKNCGIYVSGNMTVDGTLYRSTDAHNFHVGGNLIFTDSTTRGVGALSFSEKPNQFETVGNVITPQSVAWNPGSSDWLTFGTKTISQVWKNDQASSYSIYTSSFYTGYYFSDTYYLFFTTSGSYKGKFSNMPQTADSLVSWGVTKGYSKMAAYGAYIKNDSVATPILLKNSSEWTTLADTTTTACGVTGSFGNNDDGTITKLNACYESELTKQENSGTSLLYGGSFLVVKLSTNANFSSDSLLDGNFVFIMTGSSSQRLPAMTENSVVMLYLPNGSGDLMPNSPTKYYNYFIYSEGDISQFINWSGKALSGSVVMAGNSELKKTQGGTNFQYKSSVVTALADAGLIKENPAYSGKDTTETSEASSDTAKDTYYVSTSPRLKVVLESEYVNQDINVDTLTASNSKQTIPATVVVLPRIIYLPSGTSIPQKLSDFYHVMRLNDDTHTEMTGSATCPSGIPTTAMLGSLSRGVYKCTFTPSDAGYDACGFWLVVGETGTETSTTSSSSGTLSSSATTLASSSSIPDTSGSSSSVGSSSSLSIASSSSESGCLCAKYCSTETCADLKTGNINDAAFDGCLFVTSATRLSFNGGTGYYWRVNGTEITQAQPCWDSETACTTFLSSYPRVNGGWYIYAKAPWASVRSTGTEAAVCLAEYSSASGTSSSSVSGGSSSSSSAVAISSSSSAYQVTKGVYVSYPAGACYNLILAGGSVWRCTVSTSTSSDRTIGKFNGSTLTLSAWNTQATATNPGSGTAVEFCVVSSSPDVSCTTDW
ncbi:MAG: hypothetical protein WCS54_03385 [Fibrobacteraceae bacterium]